MALITPSRTTPIGLPNSHAPRARGAAPEREAAPSRAAQRSGAADGTLVLKLRRSRVIMLALFMPLVAALAAFGAQQNGAARFPAPPVEPVVRGSLLAADGTILAGGPVGARTYPLGEVTANLIGFTGKVQPDGRYGLEGLEVIHDATLATGTDVVLTLDPTIQSVTSRLLAEAAEQHGAQSGSAVVVEVGTGRILAAASFPTYDPAAFGTAGREQLANRPFTQVYEPGSVIKPLVVAGLLESGRLSPGELIDSPMTLRVGEKTFRDVAQHPPVLTVPEVLGYSSNSGMIHLGQRFSAAELHEWLLRFGIGQPLDLDSTFTRSGILNDWYRWVPQDQAANTIGQNLSTTALHLAAAYGVFANDGMYVAPRLTEDENLPAPHRVLSPEVAQGVRSMLAQVMHTGGLTSSAIPVVSSAGKTGTADIYDVASGSYLPGEYALTFAGMFPAERPRVVVVVSLHKPQGNTSSTYTVAPLFRNIGSEIVASWGVAPRTDTVSAGR